MKKGGLLLIRLFFSLFYIDFFAERKTSEIQTQVYHVNQQTTKDFVTIKEKSI